MNTKRLYFLSGIFLIILAILPLSLNAGNFGLFAYGIMLIGISCLSEKRRRKFQPIYIFCVVAVILYGILLGYFAYFNQPPKELTENTVIVLGCKVKENKPSLMLKHRLDAAVKYLKKNPESKCVVSGGQGSNETETEASVMKNYLINSGISAEKIYEEDKSKNTLQNIQNSKEIIEKENLNETAVIISDGFHQFRAYLIANKLGIKSYGISGYTSFWLVPTYCAREILSLLKLLPFFLSKI